MRCDNCHKGIMYGHNVSHSKRRTNRVFKPNLHVVRLGTIGNRVKMKFCTKCLRLLKKQTSGKTSAVMSNPPAQAVAS
ncbi:MAG: 50S ribosomal protein L28 [Candidatus Levybacteria bacterium]|nr:50S ribosomal protein L28 [Candidatus Levybacteria bacterium]